MDKDDALSEAAKERFMPPAESHLTTILNGIGNGAMLGVLPYAAYEIYSKLSGKEVPKAITRNTGFATVGGCVVGAIYGMVEARKLAQYRQSMNEELYRLRTEVDSMKTSLHTRWADKEKNHETVKAAAATR